MMFCGSYRPSDVEFLLQPIKIAFMADLELKESLIQSGARHYSEMLSPEKLPSERYLDLFHQAHQRNRAQLSGDCLRLAQLLHEKHGPELTLVSLARAGTPVGAILRHMVGRISGRLPAHYSVSIIRDRGIDTAALDEILSRGHRPESIAFIDGWTGKGVISRELSKAIVQYNLSQGTAIDGGLNVLTDLAGSAALAASSEDYLISSSILNSTISGLVSRSILNEAILPGEYHGCVIFHEFAEYDLSQWFVDDVVNGALELLANGGVARTPALSRAAQAAISRTYMKEAMSRYGIADENLIKPGIGEATRVLLRRFPERVVVRDRDDLRVIHLLALADEKAIPVEVDSALPYNAVSIIRSARDA